MIESVDFASLSVLAGEGEIIGRGLMEWAVNCDCMPHFDRKD